MYSSTLNVPLTKQAKLPCVAVDGRKELSATYYYTVRETIYVADKVKTLLS